jgi:hypothetical protein
MNAPNANPREGKIRFSNYNYDKGIFLDEKKKRFVDFVDMDSDTYKSYSDNFNYVKFIISLVSS